jgi:hypothetical protein
LVRTLCFPVPPATGTIPTIPNKGVASAIGSASMLRNLVLGIYAHIIWCLKTRVPVGFVSQTPGRKKSSPSVWPRPGSAGRPPGRSPPRELFAEATLPCFLISLPTFVAARCNQCPAKTRSQRADSSLIAFLSEAITSDSGSSRTAGVLSGSASGSGTSPRFKFGRKAGSVIAGTSSAA